MSVQLFATNDGLKAAVLPVLNTTWLGLYKSPTILAKGFDPSTLIECDFSGYARINIYTLGWSFPAHINADANAESDTPQVQFTKTGAVGNPQVYGLFYVYSDNVTVFAAQEFVGGPYRMTVDGDYIRVNPLWCASGPLFP
jgi:hypothetical protein